MKLENLIKKKADLENKSISDYTTHDWVIYHKFGDYELLQELAKLPKETVIYTIVHHVSASGMFRHIEMFRIEDDVKIPIRFLTEEFFNYHINRKTDFYGVGGCGMDMGFAIVNSLSYLVSNFQKNSDEFLGTEQDGYYFTQRWF